ncbi:MAG: hypothetical protein H6807_05010 [Planctomycetes bacterium]|nr:hypothetical protein [Planctomycetota bacterium]
MKLLERLAPQLVLAILLATSAPAQGGEARIPIRVLDGRLVARCRLSGPAKAIPVNLFIAYDRLCGLELHNKVVGPLEVEHEDGTFDPITIEFPGMDVQVEQRDHGDEADMERFTRRFAPQIDEVACVGTIGAKLLSRYVVVFDLAEGMITLREPSPGVAGELPTGPEKFYLPASAAGDMLWFPVTLADGSTRMMAVGGGRVDSVIDELYCEERGAWDGDIGPLLLGTEDLSQSIAWRPEEYDLVHPGGALGTLGSNFLEDFRVEIDASNGWVGFTRLGRRPFPSEERAFFAARSEHAPEPLLAWLGKHGSTRLGREAAELLMRLLLDEGGDLSAMKVAIDWVDKTRDPDLRASEAIDTARVLRTGQRDDAAAYAAELGVASGRTDRYPESVHRLHAMLGEINLAAGEDRKAWEHLLSAAFGLSDAIGLAERAEVDLMLGEYYERQGRLGRAMSRYVQAVITPEAGPRAVAAIERVQDKMGGEPYSVALVEKLISGKVRGMSAPTRFEETPDSARGNHVVLVEHLANPHFGRKDGESWLALAEGGAMVFEALLSHFPRERVVLLSQHGDFPQPVATMTEDALRFAEQVGGKPAFCLDGQPVAPGGLPFFETDKLYEAMRDEIVRRLARTSTYELGGRMTLEDGRVKGVVSVSGDDGSDLRLEVYLVEKAVLYPGLGGAVIHRMLVRGHLTASSAGELLRSGSPARAVAVDLALDDLVARNRRFLEDYEKRGGSSATRLSLEPDPRELAVVAVLRPDHGRAALQSIWFDLSPKAAHEAR